VRVRDPRGIGPSTPERLRRAVSARQFTVNVSVVEWVSVPPVAVTVTV
jgi:hypothetical protein